MKKAGQVSIADEMIRSKIYLIRGHKVMLDRDLAELYGVETRYLNKAVKRNIKRFPSDFMFQLTKQELENLMFQNGTSSWGGSRKLPYAFTEQGIAMLSGILNSDIAISVNIQIIRIFIKMREMILSHKDLLLKIEHAYDLWASIKYNNFSFSVLAANLKAYRYLIRGSKYLHLSLNCITESKME